MKDVLLINPPLSSPGGPYISIPVLASFLKDNSIPVRAMDLNAVFFSRFLCTGNIIRGYRYVQERFKDLNRRRQINFAEMLEYKKLFRLMHSMKSYESMLVFFRSGMAEFRDYQDLDIKARDFLLNLATAPYYPEMLARNPFFTYDCGRNPFSVREIMLAVKDDLIFSSLSREILKEVIQEKIPAVAGISVVFTSQIIPGFFCAGVIKELCPEIHVTAGGPAISIYFRQLADQTLFSLVDSLILDEGEIPLKRLYREVIRGAAADFSSVPNMVYLKKNEIVFNHSVPPPDMETMPAPDYNALDLDVYLNKRKEMRVPFRLSRGCYWRKCAFCKTDLSFVRNYQQPDPELVYSQLRTVINSTGLVKFLFSDESARPDILEFVSRRLLEDKTVIDWSAHSRVSNSLTRDRFRLYKRAGCSKFAMGIEAFNDRLLKLMNKGITTSRIRETIERNAGELDLHLYMITGFPSETVQEARAGFEEICRFKKQGLIAGFIYTPFVLTNGSDIWACPGKYGVKKIWFPEGTDLSADTYELESSGMTRKEAAELNFEFQENYNLFGDRFLDYVQPGNERIYLNHDLKKIDSIYRQILSDVDAFLPFGRMLEKRKDLKISSVIRDHHLGPEDGDASPGFKQSLYFRRLADGSLLVSGLPDSPALLPPLTPCQEDMYSMLDGTCTVREIINKSRNRHGFRDQDVFQELNRMGDMLLLEKFPGNSLKTQDRNVCRTRYTCRDLFFGARHANGTDYAETKKKQLDNTHIVLVGIGGFGTHIFQHLSALGTGKLTVVDFDRVEASNLNRQFLFHQSDLGRPKTEAAAEKAYLFNDCVDYTFKNMRIKSADQLVSLIQGADAAVLAADSPRESIFSWMNQAAWSTGVPALFTLGCEHMVIRMGPLVVPGKTACFECMKPDPGFVSDDSLTSVLNLRAGQGVISPMVGMAAGILALELLKHVTGFAPCRLYNRRMDVNLDNWKISWTRIKRRKGCVYCAGQG